MCINIQAHIVTGVNAWGMHRYMQVIYICIHVCVKACMYVHTSVYVGVCINVCIYTQAQICMLYVYVHGLYILMCTSVYKAVLHNFK